LSNHQDERLFWKTRSNGYQQLEWAQQRSYLSTFLQASNFTSEDVVLDVGTGTGIIAHAIAPDVKKVVGLDISPHMLEQACLEQVDNKLFIEGDIRNVPFPPESFDKITARMVFHHLIVDIHKAMTNCYSLLRPGGRLIISEGVPPHPDLKDWYAEMFTLKEERRTFMEDDLIELVRRAGFRDPQIEFYTAPQMSIRNWLEKSGLAEEAQKQIYQMHLDLNGAGRRYYRMRVTQNDILLDWKFVILTAKR
jgi:ubiquinone/menaquinone biosynthesis C-methylase UbiE